MKKEYKDIINQFLDGKLSTKTFIQVYTDKHLNEKREHSDELFHILDGLFAQADLTTDDPELLTGKFDFYVSEEQLKESAAKTLAELETMEE